MGILQLKRHCDQAVGEAAGALRSPETPGQLFAHLLMQKYPRLVTRIAAAAVATAAAAAAAAAPAASTGSNN